MYNIRTTLTDQKVSTGGTRRPVTARMVKQPWQAPQPERGTVCPFCPPEQGGKLDKLGTNGEVIEWHPNQDRYQMVSLKNISTTHLYHELLVPKGEARWPSSATELAEVLRIIFRIQRERVLPSAGVTHAEFGFHHGQCAGQNVAHPHWHISGSDWPKSDVCPWCNWRQKNEFVFSENDSLVALLDGVRAGETIIVSREHDWNWEGGAHEVANILDGVAQLFRERFNGPDFIISSALEPGGHFWLSYTPILNQWGYSECLATRGLGAYNQPCATEAIFDYLQTGQR